jgi:hypothetical protein
MKVSRRESMSLAWQKPRVARPGAAPSIERPTGGEGSPATAHEHRPCLSLGLSTRLPLAFERPAATTRGLDISAVQLPAHHVSVDAAARRGHHVRRLREVHLFAHLEREFDLAVRLKGAILREFCVI